MKKQDISENQANVIFLSLGSNVGNRKKNLEKAKYLLNSNNFIIMKELAKANLGNQSINELLVQFTISMGKLLDTLESQKLSDEQAANVREIRRSYDKATKLPEELVEEKARHKSQALQVWQEARSENDFAKFQPYLEKTVELTCKTAEYYGYDDNIYDALLDIYEPGMTVAQLDPLFAGLREAIVPLVKAVGESPNQPDTSFLDIGKFSEEKQRQFSMKVAESIGFDFNAGRMDTSTHPFCSGAGPNDVRFTTRYDEEFPFGCLYGVMHETGHGTYEQGLLAEHEGTPMGQAVSLGVHESESRMWENMFGRSNELCHYYIG